MMLLDSDAEWLGRSTGQAVSFLLLTWGIFKCGSIAKRPTTNARCVTALMLMLIGWLATSLTLLLIPPGNPHRQIFFGLLGLLLIGLIIGTVILAIIGLVEFSQERERYVQGRAQAIWALVLCGVFMAATVVRFFAPVLASDTTPVQPAAQAPLIFEDLNFKFRVPDRPWSQVDYSKVNPSAKLTFSRSYPELYFAVCAEQTLGSELTSDSYADLAMSRMKGIGDSVRQLDRKPFRVGKLNGTRVQVEATIRGYRLHYLQWFCVTNGWAYELMAWGRVLNQEAVDNEGEKLLQNFEMLDVQRRPLLPGKGIGSDFVSLDFDYRVRCGNPEWLEWNNLDKNCQYASFGALHRRDAALAVTAVWLMNLDPRPESIRNGMIEMLSGKEGASAWSDAQPISEQGLEGVTATFDAAVGNDKKFTYRVKILWGRGFAYGVSTWIDSGARDKEQLLSNAVSLVEFSTLVGTRPDVAKWDERTKRVHRLALNSIGMDIFREGGYADSARYFGAATDLGGAPAMTPYLGNLVQAHINAGKPADALAALDKHPEVVAVQPGLQAEHALLLGRMGQSDAAISNYAALFSTGYSSEEHFRDYIGLLAQNGQNAKAMSEIEAFLKKQDVPAVRLLQTGLLKQSRKFEEAIAILREQHQKHPFHAGITYALGDGYIQAGQPAEALTLSRESLKQQRGSSLMLFLKGRAEFALKWYRDAKESFELAQKESPSDPDVKQFLDAVSAVLGEGASAVVKGEISPVALPPELAALPSAPAPDFGRDEGAYYQQASEAVSFQRGKEMKSTVYLRLKMLNLTGVSDFSTFQIAFSPLSEELFVNRLEVRDAAGSLLSTGRVSDSYVLDERVSNTAGSRKVLNLPVAGLHPDCTIDLVYTRRELGTAKEFNFLAHGFSRMTPVQDSVLFLCGDTGAVKFASSPRMEPETIAGGLCWRQRNLPGVRWEPLQPEIADYVPIVWIGDATNTWQGLVTNYLASIQDRLDLPENQQILARAVTAGLPTVDQKIAAIAAYVQTNYTYKAIEFGRRARVPQPLPDIVRNKYGDCKDHSVLVQQMLKAAGIPASLALVSYSAPSRSDLPSLDQFDHMIVYVPVGAGEKFVDCTVKNSNLGKPWTVGLAGREALILDPAQPRFVRIADYPTNASLIHATRTVELTNQTDALVQEEIVFNGVHAGYLREYLRNILPAARRAYLSKFVGSDGQLTDIAFAGLELPGAPLGIRMTYSVRGQFQRLENQIVGSPPVGFEKAFLVQESSSKRGTPFEIAVPLTVESVVTIKTPGRFKPSTHPIPVFKKENPFITAIVSETQAEDGWKFSYRFYEPAGRHPAEDFEKHCRATQEAIDLLTPRLVAERDR